MEELKYPIGKFKYDINTTINTINEWITDIEILPSLVRSAVRDMTLEQLDTPYRQDGWTVKQVVHHLGDSHLNSYIRFKWTLTEDTPTIKAYDENKWADLSEYDAADIEDSLNFLEVLHKRLVVLLRTLTPEDLNKKFSHPVNGETSLKRNIGLYSWHGKHHLAHITELKKRMKW